MEGRTTAQSTVVEYETERCVHCGDELFADSEAENVDRLPPAVTVLIGGGEHLSTDRTPLSARFKSYRVPEVVVKWFGVGREEPAIEVQHLCPTCAASVYDVEVDR